MNRKKFIASLSLASIGTGLINPLSFSNIKIKDEPSVIKPKRLKKGDRIALITPGSYITESELQDSIKNLDELGFEVTFSERLMLQTGYFSGNDEERAKDLMEMFERDDVDGIMCARGGYGCARILPLLDYDLFRANPKVLIGYSDVTALLYGIFQNTGLVTFHGPVSISTFNEFSVDNFKRVLLDPGQDDLFKNANNNEDENVYGVTTLVSGKGKGRLVGGNLSIIVSLIGTDYDVDYSNKILFIEEIGEEPYRIDRMLTQLIESGKLENVSGIMMGIFDDCEPKEKNPAYSKSFTLMDVLKDRLSNLKVPIVYGMSFGHIKNKFTIPFGAFAELDADNQTFTLLENAVK